CAETDSGPRLRARPTTTSVSRAASHTVRRLPNLRSMTFVSCLPIRGSAAARRQFDLDLRKGRLVGSELCLAGGYAVHLEQVADDIDALRRRQHAGVVVGHRVLDALEELGERMPAPVLLEVRAHVRRVVMAAAKAAHAVDLLPACSL